jgi:hypothetical protein
MQSLAEMQSDLQTAICLQQWHEAIQLTSTMAELEEISSRERDRLLRLVTSLRDMCVPTFTLYPCLDVAWVWLLLNL